MLKECQLPPFVRKQKKIMQKKKSLESVVCHLTFTRKKRSTCEQECRVHLQGCGPGTV